jgi:hypothetical protein
VVAREAPCKRAVRFFAGAERLRLGHAIGRGACANLCAAPVALGTLSGDPVAEWRQVRGLFQNRPDLKDLSSRARMVRLIRATDALATALGGLWAEWATPAFSRNSASIFS